MNLMAKMFIVLILIMSVMFMGFSVVIYATHTNWKDRCAKLEAALNETKTKAKQMLDARDSINRGLDEELSRRGTSIANLTTKVEELDKENKAFKDELAQLKSDQRETVAAINISHNNLALLRGEHEEHKKALRLAQSDWATLYSNLVAKTDEAHALALDLATYRSVGQQLTQQYRDAIDVLRKHGLKPDPDFYSGVPPKGIKGIVTEVRPNGWLEISIGSDSGLLKGHQLDVVRNIDGRSSYIGKIEIIRTEPDQAVARIMPEFRRGTVQRDDIVSHIEVQELSAR